jgi:SAM-dependent methyltransferase
VLGLGCGTGDVSRVLRGCGETVVSLDLRFESCADAMAQAGLSPAQADAVRLPLARASFAMVVSLELSEHVDDQAAVGEIARVLAPAGRLPSSAGRHNAL